MWYSPCSVAVLLLAALCVCPPSARADDPVNVVANSGFEAEGSWEPKADGFAIVPEGRDGGMCLHLAADAPGTAVRKYSQAIRLTPGGLYRASAWMKTTDVKGGEIAPTISIAYFGNGKLLSEDFLFSGQSGTSDWHELTTGCIGTPIGSDAAVLSCYASAGVTGSAWWDDISLTPLPGEPLMQSYLLEPNYRGWMYGDYPSAFRLRVVVNYQETSLDNKDLRLRVLLRSSRGKRVLDVYRGVDQRETSWSVDRPAGLQPGRYTLQVRLTDDRRRTVLARDEHPLLQWGGKTPTARCWMDRHHRLIVDGKPFFPIGMFAGLPTEEDLQRISASPFNCLMPYFLWGQGSSGLIEDQRKYLALSERLGIKTIYSTKDLHSDWVISHLERLHGVEGKTAVLTHLVEAFRDDPNIVAWYINDEMGVADVEKVREHYNMTRDLDQIHPVWMCDYRPEVMRRFWDTSDVYGVDWYPIAWLPIDTVAKATAQAREQLFAARPRWDVPQAHNLRIYNAGAVTARPPTLEEMRNMCYQFLCNGATGLVSFCYDDLKRSPQDTGYSFLTSTKTFEEQWRDVTTVAAEVRAISPILLSVDEPLCIEVAGPEGVRSFRKAYEKATHVFVVNTARTPASATLTLPSAGLRVSVDGTAQKPQGSGRTVQVDLPPIGVCHVEVR